MDFFPVVCRAAAYQGPLHHPRSIRRHSGRRGHESEVCGRESRFSGKESGLFGKSSGEVYCKLGRVKIPGDDAFSKARRASSRDLQHRVAYKIRTEKHHERKEIQTDTILDLILGGDFTTDAAIW